jgi:hypothetical protein
VEQKCPFQTGTGTTMNLVLVFLMPLVLGCLICCDTSVFLCLPAGLFRMAARRSGDHADDMDAADLETPPQPPEPPPPPPPTPKSLPFRNQGR